jgi:hypothetical protein
MQPLTLALKTHTNMKTPSPQTPLPASVWLSRVLESDLQNLTRPRGGARLARDANELFNQPAAEPAHLGGVPLSDNPPPQDKLRPGKGPTRKAGDWPVSFPGPHPVSGEQTIVKDTP